KMDNASLTHPDDIPLMDQKLEAVLSDRMPRFELEKRYIRKDGTQIWVQNSVSLTRDGAGKPLNLVVLCQDITARKRTETALKQSEHELTEFFENASEAIHWVGPNQTILRANKAELRMLGYSADEYIGRDIADFHLDKEGIGEIFARLQAGEAVQAYASQMIAKDGSIRDVVINSSGYFENGDFVHSRCFTRDVTDETRAEKALRHLAAIVETTDDAVISKDLNGIITSWNPAAQKLYGYTAEEAIGQPVTIMIPPERPDEEPEILARLRRGERIDHYETIRIAKDGRRLHVSLTVSPIQDATGKIVGASKIARDITQQKKAQNEIARLLTAERAARQEAEVASRTKDEFLATLSHELRTPLTAMLGWLTILRSHKLDQKTTQHAIETIERNAKAQAQLIEDLVDVSRIVGGKLNLEVGPTELYPVIDAAVEVVRPAADAKHISIKLNYDPTVGPVSGDSVRLQQIVWNLLSNAVKFTPSGGSVFIDYRRQGAFAEVVVRDTGIGIAPDFLPHVFERFRQAESAATRSHRGMGLGLAIVRHLVELHGGTVSVESAGENQGSIFTIHLPLATTPKALPALVVAHDANGEPAKALNGLRILLVEDEPDARELLAILLQGSGATVEAVDSATSALQRLPLFIPDVLVSDIGLPRESGYDLIRQIRAMSTDVNKIPAIALTAFATENDRKMSLSAGFQAHLAKPVEPSDLLNTIKVVINGKN
ncbi:MAG TPA: PAS domain S-box protein, partial [Pyrinomonadaceae bacterium]|nr:PAS domain S-box protein [Pyrinomonadaceae bacterium]